MNGGDNTIIPSGRIRLWDISHQHHKPSCQNKLNGNILKLRQHDVGQLNARSNLVSGSPKWGRPVALRDTLYAMMEDEELNYLVKDGANRLPSDLAFRVNEELGQLLAEKQVEQARREGINMQEFLSPTLPASGDVFDPFDP